MNSIDISKLKRDYSISPLKRGEKPFKEDFNYLYIELNIDRISLSKYFNVTLSRFDTWIKFFNIKKSHKLQSENACRTKLLRYGNENYVNSKKMKQTKLEKYGNENYVNSDKCKQTNLKKYGVENVFQNDFIKKICKNTKLSKYGDENYNNRFKSKKTKLKKYGDENYNNSDKAKTTCFKKYGYEYHQQSHIDKEILDILLHKQKLEHYIRTNDISTGQQLSKLFNIGKSTACKYIRENGLEQFLTYSASVEESYIKQLLLKKYPDTISQYKSEKYPFKCDFYIPSIDLYIEYQGTWQHGDEPFQGYDYQNSIIKLWESKKTDTYIQAIKIWKDKDVLKRNTAKENNLNYLEFFNMNEFMEWYNKKED